MQIISNLPVYTGTLPTKEIIPNKAVQSDDDFANNVFGFLHYSGDVFVGSFNTIVGQFNVLSGEINTTASQITLDKQTVLEAKAITLQAKDAAIIAKNEAAAIYDNFDDRYLGTKSTPPTLDNDGEPLRHGALYCKESTNPEENGIMYVYDLQLGDWVNLSFVPTLFASLTDVLFNGLANGDILKYDAALGKWKNIPRDYYNKSETYSKTEIDNNIYTKAQINNILSSVVPAGTIITFPSVTVPIGYLKANGYLISRTTFANLWAFAQASGALVSDSEWLNSNQGCFSTGDGSTTFRIPDLRGVLARAWDDGRGIDPLRVFGSYQGDAYLNHSHTGSTDSQGAHTHTYSTPANSAGISSNGIGQAGSTTATTSTSGAHTHTITVNASTTGGSETRPKNIALLYCIKY